MDVAIDGQGFFQISTNGALSYSRNGQLKVDAQGYVVTTQGGRLQGNVVDGTTGVMSQITTDIRTSMANLPPRATSEIAVGSNLDARALAPVDAFDPADPGTYNNVASMTVYSPQGQAHTLAVYYRKTADNAWAVHATFDGTQIDPPAPAVAPGPIQALTFNGTGRLDPVPPPMPIQVPFPTNEGGASEIEFDFTTISQFGSPFVVSTWISCARWGPVYFQTSCFSRFTSNTLIGPWVP
jgi:flagellar hook protein FlgE